MARGSFAVNGGHGHVVVISDDGLALVRSDAMKFRRIAPNDAANAGTQRCGRVIDAGPRRSNLQVTSYFD
jgi:hypothetical protein